MRTRRRKTKKKREFTKQIVGLVMATYFIGLGVGVYVVLRILLDYPDYSVQALVAMFSYIGVPVASAIGFYCWKAKHENVNKYGNKEAESLPNYEEGV